LRVNKEIRARELRVISATGEQLGVLPLFQALQMAEDQGLDLIEIVPTANPPVAKIMDYGKFRYDQTKREKESKKSQHQVKVKEVKLSPNISEHDLDVKIRQSKEFLEKGCKVKVSVLFRGREMAHPEFGEKLLQKFTATLEEISMVETPSKLFGRMLHMILAPCAKKKK
jgi:translation initiation factor IF-3